MKKTLHNKKGFTLAELLIVVAIIAVLVAIAIPIFTSQLEKSRDAVTAANVRAAYAEASAAKLTESDGDTNVKYNSDGTVTVSGIVVKGQSTNGAFGKAAAGETAAVTSQYDLPFTLSDSAKSALDKAGDTNVTLKFSWGTDGACSAKLSSES